MTESDVIAFARQQGDGSDKQTIDLLAHWLIVAAPGVSSGYLRLAPERPPELKLEQREAL